MGLKEPKVTWAREGHKKGGKERWKEAEREGGGGQRGPGSAIHLTRYSLPPSCWLVGWGREPQVLSAQE